LDLSKQRFIVSGLLLVLGIVLSGCGSASSSSGNSEFLQPANFKVTPNTGLLVAGQSAQFATSGSSGSLVNLVWKVNGVTGGGSSTGTITASGLYTAPATAPSSAVAITAINAISNETAAPAQVSFYTPGNIPGGTVSSSNNPLVALYNVTAPFGSKVQVQFGTSTSYGLSTGMISAPGAGGTAAILVAGMRANTTYHMQATTFLASGQQVVDADHTFATAAIPASVMPGLTIPQAANAAAAPGIELIDMFVPNPAQYQKLVAYASDLSGNIVWYYQMNAGELPFPIKPLPNGNMLLTVQGLTEDYVREIDLAGNVVYQLTRTDLNTALTTAAIPYQIATLHHDVEKLANGHYLILGDYLQTISGTQVLGDVVIDWDPARQQPVWTWSAFDHLSLNHAPYGIADWTHANALVYSPDDGNLIVSMRNQNFVIKIDYQDGAGAGDILWRFGVGGDFTLPAGQNPIEWNYGQHYPSVVSPNSSGIFQLMFFNNGNGRLLDTNNDACDTAGFTACYSSVPIFELNESAKTAQIVSETNLSPHYSFCCGDALTLPNGNIEYDVASDRLNQTQSYIQEIVPGTTPQLVWEMNVAGQLVYRGFRIPSMYPGVSWTQSAIAAANAAVVKK
jgi:arylsulfate sulfotransferase